MFRQHCAFLSIDDKHRIKVGEPNLPVAAAERGRRVVSMNKSFQVGYHDFTKFSLVPSVCFVIAVPERKCQTPGTMGEFLWGLKIQFSNHPLLFVMLQKSLTFCQSVIPKSLPCCLFILMGDLITD